MTKLAQILFTRINRALGNLNMRHRLLAITPRQLVGWNKQIVDQTHRKYAPHIVTKAQPDGFW